MILPAVSGVLLLLFLVFLLITESVQITRVRGREGFIHVDDVECQEVVDSDAPLGIAKKYTIYTDGIDRDSCSLQSNG